MDTSGHIDVLEQRDSLKSPLVASVFLHVGIFVSVIFYSTVGRHGHDQFGDPHALGGGSVGVSAVKQVPLPSRGGAVNPVANDTESTVPAAPKPEPRTTRKAPPPDAIPLRGHQAKESPKPYTSRPWADKKEYGSNQLHSSSGAALSSPQFGALTGSGGVGVGPGGAFGTRFGWYRTALEQAIANKWRPEDSGGRSGQIVIVTFDIVRPSQARNVRILQSSGNRNVDYAAQRAVMEAAIPPLPPQFERDSAEIEIWFKLTR